VLSVVGGSGGEPNLAVLLPRCELNTERSEKAPEGTFLLVLRNYSGVVESSCCGR